MQKILKLVKTDQNLTKILEADCRCKLHKVKPVVPGPGTIWGNAIKKTKYWNWGYWNKDIENVEEFVYLGSLLPWDNDCSKDVRTRIAEGKGMMENFSTIWKKQEHQLCHKTDDFEDLCVFGMMLYGCETWTYNKSDRDRIIAFEMYSLL